MNWTWNVRSNDGAMNGLEFARCTTAGGFGQALIHAAPADAKIEITDGNDQVVARADLERAGEYSPMTLIELDGGAIRRSEVWPDPGLYGLPVLLAGGEVGILRRWRHSEDRSWWQWSIEGQDLAERGTVSVARVGRREPACSAWSSRGGLHRPQPARLAPCLAVRVRA